LRPREAISRARRADCHNGYTDEAPACNDGSSRSAATSSALRRCLILAAQLAEAPDGLRPSFSPLLRLTADNRLLFGGRAEFSDPTSRARSATRSSSVTYCDVPDRSGGRRNLLERTRRLHARPDAARRPPDEAFFAGGYRWHSIQRATYLLGLIVWCIAGERFEHPFFDDHFPPIPLYHGRPWFLPLVGFYYRFRDWID
jgi:hypothetical protein